MNDLNSKNINGDLPKELEALEEDVIRRIEEKVKLEGEAEAELATINEPKSLEQVLLIAGAAIMIVILPLLQNFGGIFLALFAVMLSFLAGLTSPKKPYGAALNLVVSAGGVLLFEYSAIFQRHEQGLGFLFWLYELLALIFLFATYFSAGTYRRRVLEQE